MTDPFFEIIHDGQWNACVGVQGSEINYVEGYIDAARIIADRLVGEEMMGKRDTLVMPILYNARHGLELAMKFAVTRLIGLGLARRPEGRANHHILRYWQHLRDAGIPDRGIREVLDSLEPFVRSLSRVDIDGQQLRYFTTANDKQSLGDQSVVHLLLVRDSVEQLGSALTTLTERIAVLLDEHPTGTRTTRCSRSDLHQIAAMVGARASWTRDDFLERRDEVMSRFGLSRKAFSNALDAIQASRELAGGIGVEHELVHVADSKVIHTAELWLAANPPTGNEAPMIVNPRDIGVEEIDLYARSMRELVSAVGEALTLEEFADVETVFYTGRNREFGEYYEAALQDTVNAYRLEERRRPEKIYHILSKLNFLDGLTAGLRRIGRPSLGDRIALLRTPAAGR